MTILSRGANAPLQGNRFRAVLSWATAEAVHDIDLSALLLLDSGRVRDEDDFVFYNQPVHATGSVRHGGRLGTSESVMLDVGLVPEDVQRIALAASVAEGTFGAVRDLALVILDDATGEEQLRFEAMGATVETAFVVGELYRREGAWKFRAVGQGWDSGLATLAVHFGVTVEQPVETAPAVEPPPLAFDGPVAAVLPEPPAPQELRPATSPASAAAPPPGPQPAVLIVPRSGHGLPTLDGDETDLAPGQAIDMSRRGSVPDQVWVRVTHTQADALAVAALSATLIDRWGEPLDVVDCDRRTATTGGMQIARFTIRAAADDSAALAVRLPSLAEEVAAVSLGVTSYSGGQLSALGSFVVELVETSGTVLARAVSAAPGTSALVLATFARTAGGGWAFDAVAAPARGRTAESLFGASVWAACA